MKGLKRISINSDTNLFVLNAIVVPVAVLYLEVTVASSGRELRLPIRVNPHVPAESLLRGVDYRMYMPVLACHPSSDTEFYAELGYTDVNLRYFDMSHQKCSHLAYLGVLPDVAESDVRDKRYVVPLRVNKVELPDKAPGLIKRALERAPIYGATLRTVYLRTSLLDQIDDVTWEELRATEPKGIAWSEFLDAVTLGKYVPKDDLSNCLEDIDQEFVPERIVKRITHAQFERRMRE